MDVAIKVENVSKVFKVFKDRPQTLKETFMRGFGEKEEFYALRNVSFDIKKGSTVGLIGSNGSGKSTLLKIINRTMFPNTGTVTVNGKVASLIELGAGFHPDLTGRENIYTNATVLGLSKIEIERRTPEIIRFSELDDFIDAPVRTYSSGMYARLAFSVAINVNCDILLVDEILSVGDMNFQAKCNNHIRKLKDAGTTIVIVSHSMGVLDQLCDYALFFNKGELLHQGEPRMIQFKYMEFMAQQQEERIETEMAHIERMDAEIKNKNEFEKAFEAIPHERAPGLTRWGNQQMVLKNFKLLDSKGVDRRTFYRGEKIKITYKYECKKNPETIDPIFGFGIYHKDGWTVFGTNTMINQLPPIKLNWEEEVEWSLTPLTLLPGDYIMQIAVIDRDGRTYDYQNEITEFRIVSDVVGEMGTSWMGYEVKIGNSILGGTAFIK